MRPTMQLFLFLVFLLFLHAQAGPILDAIMNKNVDKSSTKYNDKYDNSGKTLEINTLLGSLKFKDEKASAGRNFRDEKLRKSNSAGIQKGIPNSRMPSSMLGNSGMSGRQGRGNVTPPGVLPRGPSGHMSGGGGSGRYNSGRNEGGRNGNSNNFGRSNAAVGRAMW